MTNQSFYALFYYVLFTSVMQFFILVFELPIFESLMQLCYLVPPGRKGFGYWLDEI